MKHLRITTEQYLLLMQAIAGEESRYKELSLDCAELADYYRSKQIEYQQLMRDIVESTDVDSQ